MAVTATYTVEQFLAETRATIKAKGLPSGLEEIRQHVERLLANPTLLQDHLGDPVPYRERTTIGYDAETDVHVLVHGREQGGKSVPHDHGPCWVVYGQYRHYTDMTRWKRLDSGKVEEHAELPCKSSFASILVRQQPLRKATFIRSLTVMTPSSSALPAGMWKSTKRCASIWTSRRSKWKTGGSARGRCAYQGGGGLWQGWQTPSPLPCPGGSVGGHALFEMRFDGRQVLTRDAEIDTVTDAPTGHTIWLRNVPSSTAPIRASA